MSRGSAENRAAFDEAAILADACKRAGLEDFGPDPFREPFSVLLKSLREEAPLNELGRTVMRLRILESLEARLVTQEWIRRHPEILKEELGAPIVIMGLMRTGTTMLHRIVASDPRNHAADWWEVRFPAPALDTDWTKPDPRIAAARAEVAAILEADPRQASIHPWDAEAPDEEIMLLEHSFLSHVPEAFVNIPTYRRFITEADWTPAYVYLRKQFQFLQWQKRQRGNVRERWILKTPGHLGYVDTLFKIFPGARVIFNHRDPVETVPSAASMNFAMWALYGDPSEASIAAAQWQERLAWGTNRAMEARKRYDANRFADIWFKDVMRDPIAEVERVYGIFGIEMTAAARAAMQAWRDRNPREKRPPHEYELSEYGLTREGICAAFAEYRKQFIESRKAD
ncbi:MAG: sulfotransferase [Myxococcota bacterium]